MVGVIVKWQVGTGDRYLPPNIWRREETVDSKAGSSDHTVAAAPSARSLVSLERPTVEHTPASSGRDKPLAGIRSAAHCRVELQSLAAESFVLGM